MVTAVHVVGAPLHGASQAGSVSDATADECHDGGKQAVMQTTCEAAHMQRQTIGKRVATYKIGQNIGHLVPLGELARINAIKIVSKTNARNR